MGWVTKRRSAAKAASATTAGRTAGRSRDRWTGAATRMPEREDLDTVTRRSDAVVEVGVGPSGWTRRTPSSEAETARAPTSGSGEIRACSSSSASAVGAKERVRDHSSEAGRRGRDDDGEGIHRRRSRAIRSGPETTSPRAASRRASASLDSSIELSGKVPSLSGARIVTTAPAGSRPAGISMLPWRTVPVKTTMTRCYPRAFDPV